VIRLAIVEDHTAIAEGLAALLGSEPDIEVETIVGTAEAAHRLLTTDGPDVVLCDVMLGGRDQGFALLEEHAARTRFVMYSAYDFPAHHVRAVAGGAYGYVSKVAPAEEIVAAIRHAAAGERAFAPHVLRSARGAAPRPTARELQLLELLADGATNDELARRLAISSKTVEGTIRRLFDRYGVDNRTQLARLAMRQGWLTGNR
jgi:DNA-binding NarL/FixJ family response regulator